MVIKSFCVQCKKKHSQHQVWESGNHPIDLYIPRVIRQKLRYVHYNPVEDKIVAKPKKYLYSSAANYHDKKGILEDI